MFHELYLCKWAKMVTKMWIVLIVIIYSTRQYQYKFELGFG